MINNTILIGRLTKEPELRTTNNGKTVVSFNIAIDGAYDREDTSFITCTAWNKQAENLATYGYKGMLVAVQGRLNQRSYENAQGQKTSVVEVVCSNIDYLSRKEENTPQAQNKAVQGQPLAQPQQVEMSTAWMDAMQEQKPQQFDIVEDDIEF